MFRPVLPPVTTLSRPVTGTIAWAIVDIIPVKVVPDKVVIVIDVDVAAAVPVTIPPVAAPV
jgi:hypothetical protein